jgi:hypothetical protein
MPIARLFSSERIPQVINTTQIAPYTTRNSTGRHPIICAEPRKDCDFKYLLEAMYQCVPLAVRGQGKLELVSLHGIRRVQLLPDSMSESPKALPRVSPEATLIRLVFPLGEEPIELALEHVRGYEVKGQAITLKDRDGSVDIGYLTGAFHTGEPLALLYNGQEEHGDIVSLRSVRNMEIVLPS